MASNYKDIQERDSVLIFPKIISFIYWIFLRRICHASSRIQFLFFPVPLIGFYRIWVKRMRFNPFLTCIVGRVSLVLIGDHRSCIPVVIHPQWYEQTKKRENVYGCNRWFQGAEEARGKDDNQNIVHVSQCYRSGQLIFNRFFKHAGDSYSAIDDREYDGCWHSSDNCNRLTIEEVCITWKDAQINNCKEYEGKGKSHFHDYWQRRGC